LAALLEAVFFGASPAGVALAAVAAGGAVEAGRDSGASACTVRVQSVSTNPASATEEAPATNQMRSEAFVFVLLEIRRLTICPFY
jgi:hypothetical protein